MRTLSKNQFDKITDEGLIQFIGELKNPNDLEGLLNKRIEICEILNRIEYTIESYGFIIFLVEYEDEINDLNILAVLLKEFEDFDSIYAIKKSTSFFIENKHHIERLRENQFDYEETYEMLNTLYLNLNNKEDFHIPLKNSITIVATHIRTQANEMSLFLSKNNNN